MDLVFEEPHRESFRVSFFTSDWEPHPTRGDIICCCEHVATIMLEWLKAKEWDADPSAIVCSEYFDVGNISVEVYRG